MSGHENYRFFYHKGSASRIASKIPAQMLILIILLFLVLLPVIGYYLVPSGTALHEVLHLPVYWQRLAQTDTSSIAVERIAYGRHFRQYFLSIPPAPNVTQQDKIVVYFHGGGWKFGRPEQFLASVAAFHQQGYPVIMPSVRRTPLYNYYDLRADLDQLLLQLGEWQQQQGYGRYRLVVGGMSSGGNLAALLALNREALDGIGRDQSAFAGLLLLGAPLSLEKMHQNPVLYAFAGKRDSTQFQAANPINHLENTIPLPIFCIHGRKDGLVAHASALDFVAAYQRRHPGLIHFVEWEGGTHLDAAAWSHPEVNLQEEILSWLKKLSS